MYSYTLDGVTYNDPIIGIDDFTLTLERTFGDDNLFREFVETTLTFTGSAYCYLCGKLNEDYCSKVDVKIYFDSNLIFEGIVIVSFGQLVLKKKTFETELVDTSYRGLIRERTKNQISLNSILTVGCEPLSPLPVLSVPMYNVNNTYVRNVPMFDVYDVFKYLIYAMSDNTVQFQSTYLKQVPFAITTGWLLSNTVNSLPFRQYPTVVFQEMYKTFRALCALYASLEIIGGQPTIVMEQENYWFKNSNSGYSLSNIPEDTTISVDEERIYSVIEIGSEDYDEKSTNNAFLNQKTEGWARRKINSCGCIFDLENTKDLTPDYIIDSGAIMDMLADPDGNDKIYVVQLDPTTGNTPLLLPHGVNGKYFYNSSLRNEIVALLWSFQFNNCVYGDRTSDNQFFTENDLTPPNPDDKNIQEISGLNVCRRVPFNTTIYGRYRDTITDNYNGVKSPNGNLSCETTIGFAPYHTIYECQTFGLYAFSMTRRLVMQWASQVIPYSISFTITYYIEIFEDDTYSNLLDTYSTSQILIANETGLNGLIDTTLQVDTDVMLLNPGNVARVRYQVVSSGFEITLSNFIFLEGYFRSNDELVACSVIENGARIPYLVKFTQPMCKADYDLISANRDKYIDFNGIKGWVKRLDYNPKGLGTFELLTTEIPDCNE